MPTLARRAEARADMLCLGREACRASARHARVRHGLCPDLVGQGSLARSNNKVRDFGYNIFVSNIWISFEIQKLEAGPITQFQLVNCQNNISKPLKTIINQIENGKGKKSHQTCHTWMKKVNCKLKIRSSIFFLRENEIEILIFKNTCL